MNADAVMRRNNVRVLGRADGPVLMLVQGFGCDQVIWDRILPCFIPAYRVVLMDHAGTGGAGREAYDPVRHASLQGYLQDLVEVLDALALPDVTIVGHSIAGMMALAAAVDNPHIGRLVLLGGSARYLNDGGYTGGFGPDDAEAILRSVEANYPLWAATVSPAMVGAEPRAGLSDEFERRLCRLSPDFVHSFLRMALASDVRPLLPQVAVPCLILQTRADPLTPAAASRYLHTHLPNSTLEELEVSGNMPHLNAPVRTAQAILDYLETDPHA